jgi:transcriptional regulator with XRE-family HTH domain
MEVNMGDFKTVFKELRLSVGLSQDEMAKKLGVSRSTIGMYETGARKPDSEMLEKIADMFNIDIDYLLGRTQKTTLLPETIGKYYLNDETARIAQQIYDDPDLHALFDAAKDAKPEDMQLAADLLKRLKKTNPDG